MNERADAWAETAMLLWPGSTASAVARRTGPPPGERVLREFIFVPNAKRPRLLLPAGAPMAAAAALQRYSHDLGRSQRIGRNLLSVAMRTGLPERALPDRLRVSVPVSLMTSIESVESYLGEILGREVFVSLGLGTPRANRKPVLHVLTTRGESLAFVKVGDTEVTRKLVRAEAATLDLIDSRPLRHLTLPRVLRCDCWHGLQLLVLSPLVTPARQWQRRAIVPIEAMRELAAINGLSREPLSKSAFWQGVRDVPMRLLDDVTSQRLLSVLDHVSAVHHDTILEMGAWHGDWTPWNMAWQRETVQLWDWERFAQGVPLGFDALHYRLQDSMCSVAGRSSAMQAWVTGATNVLQPFGITGREARATVTLYLVELCCRYLLAAQDPIGEPLRPRARWLLEFLCERVDRL